MKLRPLPLRSKTPQGIQEIWDSTQRKIAILVLEADDKVTDKDKATLSVTLSWGGKIKQQTSQKKKEGKAKNAVWNEFFVFGADTGGPELTLEVFQSKKLGRDESLGSGVIFHAEEPPTEEKVLDLWIPLQNAKKKTAGKVHVRLLYSCSPETRPVEERGQQVFYYDDHVKKLKTGDLVLYSGIGLIHTYNKMLSNSEYSHVGMIFRLPNKWTRRDDVYVLEVHRNQDGFLDGFLETPNSGLSLFRFFERIHQFHGVKIWYSPLTPSSTFDSAALVSEMWKVHSANVDSATRFQAASKKGDDEKIFYLEKEVAREFQGGSLSKSADSGEGQNLPLLDLIECHHFAARSPALRFQLLDLLDAALITHLLRRAGMGELTEKAIKGRLFPADVAGYKCYEKPILLRDVDLNAEPTEKEEGDVPQQYFVVQNPMMPMPFMPMMPMQQGQQVPMMPMQQGGFPQQQFMPQMMSPMQQHMLQQQQMQQQQMQQQQMQQQQLQQQQMQQQMLQQQQQQQRMSVPQQPPQQPPQMPQGFPMQQQPAFPFQQQPPQPMPLQHRASLENLFVPPQQPLYPSLPDQGAKPPPFNPEYLEQVKASAPDDQKTDKKKQPVIVIH